jgi:probable F420-dependent oxidoreductase
MTDPPTPRLAVLTPVLTMMPGAHAVWEESGTIEDVVRIAETADALGYDHITCSEHFAVPHSQAVRRGGTYWDPLSTFGYVAARTTRIRLATNVLVLGYHHPLEIAKRYGTLDRVSGGRVVLGVGVGTLKEEFDLLGAPYEDRGDRADDSLRALRASLSKAEPSYQGTYYDYRDVVVDPSAVQERVPIWVGGPNTAFTSPSGRIGRRLVPLWGELGPGRRVASPHQSPSRLRGAAQPRESARPDS